MPLQFGFDIVNWQKDIAKKRSLNADENDTWFSRSLLFLAFWLLLGCLFRFGSCLTLVP